MDRKNIFTKVIIIILVLMFIGGIVFGAVDVLSAEGQMPPDAGYQESLTKLPKSEDEVIVYLNSCIDLAVTEKAKLDVNTEFSIGDDSISFGPNGDLLKKSFVFAKETILSDVIKQYSPVNIDFGDDFSGKLWNLKFNKASIAGVESNEDGDNYAFKITFPNEDNPFGMNGVVNQSFHMSDAETVLGYLIDKYKGFASIDNVNVKCTDLEIDSAVNRLTNKVSNITYIKKLNIEADITFLGELSAIGTRKLSFNLQQNTAFHFTWANLSLVPKTLNIKKGDIKVVSAIITASGDIKAKWSSSNPDVASVDSDGYVKARQVSKNPVTITAEFDFLGEKYSDTCEVYVKVAVTKVKLSDKKIALSTGETKQIEAWVKPDDATIVDVLWFTSNPSVATVDNNGNVTGTGKGKSEIYVLSKDGYYKLSCEVNVMD